MELLLVTGQAGAGKTQAANVLEDFGYYRVDNLPLELVDSFVEMALADPVKYGKSALVLDSASEALGDRFFGLLETLRARQVSCRVLFLEASDEVVISRYKETRRAHPMQSDTMGIEQGIAAEKLRLAAVRERADWVINTDNTKLAELRQRMAAVLDRANEGLTVYITTFGFKYGLLADIDLLFDARFLPNPYYIEALRPLTGHDAPIRDYLASVKQYGTFMAMLCPMVDFLVDNYALDGRSSLNIGVGCTGGRHRSVAVAVALAEYLQEKGHQVRLAHRDIERPV